MKRISVFIATLFFAAMNLAASVDSLVLSKCDPSLTIRLLQRETVVESRASVSPAATDTLALLVTCADAARFVETLALRGMTAYPITSTVATAYMLDTRVAEVAALEDVVYLEVSQPAQPQMDKARVGANVDAMHTGEGLESPFTGRGVIVGVIDQGFEYVHPAFSDAEGRLRIVGIWNRYRNETAITDTARIRSKLRDGINAYHATHVAGIAAGTPLPENDYGGVAPDADIIMIPSDFTNVQVLEGVRFIREEAAKAGKPFVINMSFGTGNSPHDGSDTYTQSIDEMLGAGGLNVSAVGNGAIYLLHASKTLTSATDTLFLPVDHRSATAHRVNLLVWSEDTAATSPDVSFYVYNTATKTLRTLTDTEYTQLRSNHANISRVNGKYNFTLEYSAYATFLSSQELVCVAFSGGDAGQTYHAWISNTGYGSFLSEADAGGLTHGDNRYQIMSPADSRRTIAVGAWCTRNSYTALSGSRVPLQATENAIFSFSSYGPMVGESMPKPLICAPGGALISSYSKQATSFTESSSDVVSKVERGGASYYYGALYGTSMAAPMVTGAIACWLQAYPELTPEEAIDIIAETAVNDAYTGDARDNWHPQWGYGKFDAYAGLKACIAKAQALGVNAPLGEQPFTLSRGTDVWRICFNQPVSRAALVVTAVDGSVRMRRTLSGVTVGHEETIALDGFVPGVYIVHMEADGVKWTRKFAR